MKDMEQKHLEKFKSILGTASVITDIKRLETYSHDYTEDLREIPPVVLVPVNAGEVSAVLSYCNAEGIGVTPRGAGTGLSGGAIPFHQSVIVSLERMNRIIEIDEKNFTARVEPGVINEHLRSEAEKLNLFYAPDPASKGSCMIGGNIAHNSGGPRALKYGVTRDHVLNLEVVLANGSIIQTGADSLKNSTGYSLTHLMIGSEGTLGIVTQALLRLLPKPQHTLLLLAGFNDFKKACEAVSEVFSGGVSPSALELMERKGVELSANHLQLSFPFQAGHEAYLLIELDGQDQESLMVQAEQLQEILTPLGVDNLMLADTHDQKEQWWKIRRAIGEVVKLHSVYKEEDTVVPRYALPELLSGVKEIGKKYGFESVCYGHAGDGNLHVNILKGKMTEEEWNGKILETGIREIFRLCKSLGGTISGEHGIGWVQKKYLNEVFEPVHFELMRGIKQAFDPKGILNPGKIFD